MAGQQVGTNFNLSATPGLWQQTSGTFNPGAGGPIVVSIVNFNTASAGNDFTLDDIHVIGAAAAPEPDALALLAASLPIAGYFLRRKRPLAGLAVASISG